MQRTRSFTEAILRRDPDRGLADLGRGDGGDTNGWPWYCVTDGMIASACPPVRTLLEIMADGKLPR